MKNKVPGFLYILIWVYFIIFTSFTYILSVPALREKATTWDLSKWYSALGYNLVTSDITIFVLSGLSLASALAACILIPAMSKRFRDWFLVSTGLWKHIKK